ncbi:type IV pilus modification PilV family protein [Haliangium ochraceum]|uniref:Prepilin-type N-terminal cleavage/methylation domain-containing protein n=1 Tax=Haliangium ochraceum (strain DSM 14365 / JCM 11303 / SMP-2) TaxID=502025 RepID=D0LLW8_HALO1|nr:hypothetical protein [Haliangium ochraceum]ACY15146.1 hypothetical protein Hoch_2613 [Haliangium ochraceum DSM 14365]
MTRVASLHTVTQAMARRRALGGFTMLEVLLALGILSIALVGLLGRTTANVRITQEIAVRGAAVNLARGKMYDIEDELLREGFQELEQTFEGDFSDEGWPDITFEAVVEKIELPNMNSLEALQDGAEGGAEDDGSGGVLGGILSSPSDSNSPTADGSAEGAFVSGQFEMLSQVMEVSIRKVTLHVRWKVGNEEQSLEVACYFTDPAAMQQVLPNLGALLGGGGAAAGDDSGDSDGAGSDSRGSGSSSGGGASVGGRGSRGGATR